VARGTAQEGRPAGGCAPPSTHARAPLPVFAADCPALEPAFGEALDAALAGAGIVLDAAARAGIEAQARLLMAWTAAINLTAIRTPGGVALEHVADSLAALPLLRGLDLPDRPAVLDLGSGGGYPGLPLGLVLPAGRLALLDSIGKKARFLRVAADAAAAALTSGGREPPRIDVLALRAETMAADPDQLRRWDLVTARAVGQLRVLAELALPLLRPGGWLVAWKRDAGDGALSAELATASATLTRLGGAVVVEERTGVAGLEDHRLIAVQRHAQPRPNWAARPAAGRPRRPPGAAC
jgi:16S rRNA (guanine527-N7)-methyltransferase